MPNRIIKESICTSEDIDKLSTEAEIFFYRLMVTVDDYGIMFAAPSILRSKCFPWKIDKIKDKDIEKWMDELRRTNLIYLYEYEGKQYLKYTKWEHHQQVRATKSKYPTPDLEGVQLIAIDINGNQLKANAPVIVIDNSNRIRNREKIIEKGYTNNFDLQETILDFMDMRIKIKEPMTDKAIDLLLKKLDKLAKTDDMKIEILEQSILSNWKSVFPVKGGNETATNKQNNKRDLQPKETIGFSIG